ncbi:MAG: oxidoreductase [Planctomycetota bacterium]|nr:MAG: oxidoreductase [Planctomycetota bacterium]
MGMVGGGNDAFIGQVHRIAAAIDGQIELVCGAFSSTKEKSKLSGKQLYLPDERVYGSYDEMFEKELALPADVRMEFVSIVTPNHLHYPIASKALASGFHVMSDKPATLNLDEILKLREELNKSGLLYGLTHNYTGYPMVKEAKEMVKTGKLGKIRKVVVEYPQGWLSTDLESSGQKQAAWRTDPARSGGCGCMGDIGTHAENLMEYITDLQIESICADLNTFVEGRQLDDDGNVLFKLNNGAKGVLHASQISVGEENGLKIYVYGELAGLFWRQLEPNTLQVMWPDRPTEIVRTGANHTNLSERALYNTRLPAGHPEGFLEAFANIYRNFASTLQAKLQGREPTELELDFPQIEDGVRGMAFIDTLIRSQKCDDKWIKITEY